jgi:Flp pilus assembly protein TadG
MEAIWSNELLSRRRPSRGNHMIVMIGLTFVGLMISALAIDFTYYFCARNIMQTAADSAALAAAEEMYRDITPDPATRLNDARTQAKLYLVKNQPNMTLENTDVLFGYINPATRLYDPNTFSTPSNNPNYAATNGYNAVRILVRKTADSSNGALNTIMANMVGLHKMDVAVGSVALVDQAVSGIDNGGLRPIYACQAQFNRTMQDSIPENNVVRIYGDHVEIDGVQNVTGCPAMGSGNWGFADFTNCGAGTVGASTIRDWFASGYPGPVNIGQCYSTKPGNFISSMRTQLDTLVANGTVFPIPLYDSWGGNGSNTHVNVSGFAGFKITNYVATGAQANRYIEGRFYRYVCRMGSGCTTGGSGTISPAGSVVRLRLASTKP